MMKKENKFVEEFDDGSAFITIMVSKDTLDVLKQVEKEQCTGIDRLCESAVENAADRWARGH